MASISFARGVPGGRKSLASAIAMAQCHEFVTRDPYRILLEKMSMHATGQRDEQVSSLPLDLNPPVRPESIELRVLIGHRCATQASASVESVVEIFKTGIVNFVAVLEGQRLLGMCSRQETAALLGGRYGFRCGHASRSGTIFANRKRVSRWRRQSAMSCAPCLRVPTQISTMMSYWWMKVADSLGSSVPKRFSNPKTRSY